ncbi:MAG: hypothetical protein ACWGSQ_03960 [Longimicrobiales bacterium]
MADAPIDERRFTDDEVREILKKAVEKAPSRALARRDGLSLAELKAIGGEVGIDPARMEEAARAVALRKGQRTNRILGAPTVLTFERKVPGEFNPEDTPEILSLIRRTMGRQGEVDEIHGSLEWTAKGDSGERYVTLSSRDGTTTISGSANLSNAAILTYLPAGMMGLITSLVGLIKFVQDGSQIGLVVCLAVLPTLYPILRTILRMISGSEAARLEEVVDELARLPGGSGD